MNELEKRLALNERVARESHEAATHEESAKEDKHDTRSTELSYLAGAQAERVKEVSKLIGIYKQVPIRRFDESELIAAGSFVVIESENEAMECFLLPTGQGSKIEFEGKSLNLITPSSPLGQELFGREIDEEIEVEIQGVIKKYEITQLF